MGCDPELHAKMAAAIKATSDDVDEMREDKHESSRKAHRKAMRFMSSEGRSKYAESMDDDDERETVASLKAEMDEEDRGKDHEASDEKEKDDEGHEGMSRIASMVSDMNRQLKAMKDDIRVSKFTEDVSPRVAEISRGLKAQGIDPAPFQGAVATMGPTRAIEMFGKADAKSRYDGVGFNGGSNDARQASAGGGNYVSASALLGGGL